MGAAPSIDGGMTEAQYKSLQMEERQFQAKLEEDAYARAEESEAKRVEMEEANQQRLASQEDAEKLAVQQSEMALQGEVSKLDEEEAQGNMGAIDFYGALSKGQSSETPRPE